MLEKIKQLESKRPRAMAVLYVIALGALVRLGGPILFEDLNSFSNWLNDALLPPEPDPTHIENGGVEG